MFTVYRVSREVLLETEELAGMVMEKRASKQSPYQSSIQARQDHKEAAKLPRRRACGW